MIEESLHQRVQRTVIQAARQGRGSEPARPPASSPAAGELWVLPGSAEVGIQWMALEPQGDDRWLLVAADTFPLSCADDVALPEDSFLGKLRVRVRFLAAVPATELTASRYSGKVSDAVLAKVRTRVQLSADQVTADEVDEPSYERWVHQFLGPAVKALQERFESLDGTAASGARLAAPPAARTPAVTPVISAVGSRDASPPRRLAWTRFLAAAAMAILVAGLTTLTWVQSRQIGELEATRELAGNLPIVWLGDEEAKRSARPSSIAPGRSSAVLLMIEPPELADLYRLNVVGSQGVEVWTSSEMGLGEGTELAVALPVGRLADGELVVRLFSLANGNATLLAEYPLVVTAR